MKKRVFLMSLLVLFGTAVVAQHSPELVKKNVKEVMRKVADWQIANHSEVSPQLLGWENSALYLGMYDWAELAESTEKDEKYHKFLMTIFNRGGWQPAKRMYHADDICVSQVYIDYYRKYKKVNMLNPTICRTDWVMANPGEQLMKLDYPTGKGLDKWTWCDALFMAPPVYARLYSLTGDEKYIEYMNKEFKQSYDYLYDQEEKLFYRDWRYFAKKEANGEKVFWGRGNGWVLGGLSEILQQLPKGDTNRTFYEELFVEMCDRIVELQREDGYYSASMLDSKSFPSPETSATGFIIYAFAYGVNEGILDKGKYMPAITKGWEALVKAVEENGKLGYVQPVGADPRKVTREMTAVYGVGAFLLTGNQVYKMAP